MTTTATAAPGSSAPLRVAAAAAVGCAALVAWNPGDDGVALCPTAALTGLDCPFCGGLRTVASLGRADVARAADHNLLLVIAAPLAVAWWFAWWRASRHGRPAPRVSSAVWIAVAAVALVFTVVRNLDVAGLPHWLAATASP